MDGKKTEAYFGLFRSIISVISLFIPERRQSIGSRSTDSGVKSTPPASVPSKHSDILSDSKEE